MKKLIGSILIFSASLLAQPVETIVMRAVMLPSNEVPAIDLNASGIGTVRLHVVRDADGQIVSGTADFSVNYKFPEGEITFTGFHIHRGVPGENGGVVINTGLGGGAASVVDPTGTGSISRAVQIRPTDTVALAALRDLVVDQSQFYINLHTTIFPGGVIRGLLRKPETTVLMGQMMTANEVPPIETAEASGFATITAMRTFDENGKLETGLVTFDVDHILPPGSTISGLHIHNGVAGVNAGVVINTGTAGLMTETGRGNILRPVEIDLNNAPAVDALNGLYTNPAGYYVNIHTTEFPGGIARSQLRRTDATEFQVTMLPANEVPPVDIQASGAARVLINTLRAPDGTVSMGRVTFDVNYRFPGAATFVGLHIHNQTAGNNGPVTIDSGLSGANTIVSETGFGNVERAVNVFSTTGLSTLNSVVVNPENHYVNIHTQVNPGGAVRSQLGPAGIAAPSISDIVSAADPAMHTLGWGSLVAVSGRRLTKVSGGLEGWAGQIAPTSLNGVTVTIGGHEAALLSVTPTLIWAQIPFDAPLGTQELVVTRGEDASEATDVSVDEFAPVIFLNDGVPLVRKADLSFVTADNPVSAGDVITVYSAGLGQTIPPLETGMIVVDANRTQEVTVSVGGISAEVMSSTALPGMFGVYQTTLRIPSSGLQTGDQTLVLQVGGASSNTVSLPIV